MILIQIVLLVGFIAVLLKFMISPNSYQIKAWAKLAGIIFFLLAIVAILLPDTLTRLAHFVGVGRGADLLLYVLTLSFIVVTLTRYVNGKQDQRNLVQLARKVALFEARQRYKDDA